MWLPVIINNLDIPGIAIGRLDCGVRCWIGVGNPRTTQPGKMIAARLLAELLITDQRNDTRHVMPGARGNRGEISMLVNECGGCADVSAFRRGQAHGRPPAVRLTTWCAGRFIAGTDGRTLVSWWSEDEA